MLAAIDGHVQLVLEADSTVIVIAERVLETSDAGSARHVATDQALAGIAGPAPAS